MSQNDNLIDKVQPQATVDYMDVDKAGGTNDANAKLMASEAGGPKTTTARTFANGGTMFINTTIDTTIDTTHPDPAHIRASTERLMALRNAALKDTTPKKRRARARKYPASQTPGDEETNTNKTEADANAILSLSKQLNMTGAETAAILTAGNKLMALKSAGREATFEALGDEAPTAEIKKLLALKGNVDDITAALKTPGEGKTSNKTKEVPMGPANLPTFPKDCNGNNHGAAANADKAINPSKKRGRSASNGADEVTNPPSSRKRQPPKVPVYAGAPIPKTWLEASSADRMLYLMREQGKDWSEIREEWKKLTGEDKADSTLPNRLNRFKANFLSLKEGDAERLITAKRDVEVEHEKMKWALIADRIHTNGGGAYPAAFLQKKYKEIMFPAVVAEGNRLQAALAQGTTAQRLTAEGTSAGVVNRAVAEVLRAAAASVAPEETD